MSDRQKLHTAALVEPAGERRKQRKARKHAAASIESAARKTEQAQERVRVAAERAERRNTTYLPAAGEPGAAALRTPGHFRLPRHQDTSATLAGAYPFLAEGGLESPSVDVVNVRPVVPAGEARGVAALVGGTIMAYLGGMHYWWPKISGRLYPEGWAKFAALVIFVGFNLTFFPQFILGYLGMPRRYHMYPDEFQVLNVLSTAGATILGVGYAIPLIYLTWSFFKGAKAPANPWGATGLEWQTPSPPPLENFTTTPIVTQPAYAYAEEHTRA